jgi:hypothetical protein
MNTIRSLIAEITMVGIALAQGTLAQAPTATIHVYREKHLVGFAISPSIYVDGIALQRLNNGTLFVAKLTTGKHMITVGRSEVGLFIEFEPDKHYYFRMDHKNWAGTAVSGRQPVFLSQVPADEAEGEMKTLKALKVK